MTGFSENRSFDAVVIGSGATGGYAAQQLCKAGLDVAVIEAGSSVLPPACSRGTTGRTPIQARCSAYNQRTSPYFIEDLPNPYSTLPDKPFSWIRSRMVGGRTLIWSGQCYRMSDLDFKAGEADGHGESWPITYQELAPFYAQAERLLEVTGTCDGIAQLPDGCFSGPSPANALLLHLREAFARRGAKLIPARISVRSSNGGSSCVRCGRVNAGCIEHSTSVNSTLAAAMATGRLTLFSDTIVRHLASDREGNAIAAYVIDRESHREFKISGGMFFLCASTLESTRILLNSGSAAHSAGLGNSGGTLGHYLVDHLSGISLTAQFRYSGDTGENGSRPVHLLYIPRSHNLSHDRSEDFLRGYGWQVTAMRIDDYSPDSGPGCGAGATRSQSETRRRLSDTYVLRMQAFGEMLPRFENYVEIDPAGLRDAWGVPALRIHCAHGANEKVMARHMIASAYAFADALGASVISCNKTLSEPGLSVHEAGTCRMGPDPKNSVLNRFNQCHDAPNVFVTDGSSFTSQGTQNPTLTMMALTARACEYAVQQARRNDLKRRPKHRSQ